ncbi:MAG TPA: hypothetical protein VE548_08220 [Nitrososphaeraceae archaeon]|jgi:hypothetical protein|nr:hypothetical protein [Nitrososphaeraceae archaeon]
MKVKRNNKIIIIAAAIGLTIIGIGVWSESISTLDPEPPNVVNRERMNFGVETKGIPHLNETIITDK